MTPLKNISGCVLFFGKMSILALYLEMRVYHMIIQVFGKVQGPTSTGDLHDEYFKNKCSHKPQNYKQHVVYTVNADLQVLSEFKVPVT